MPGVSCPIEGCDFVFEVPGKGPTLNYLTAYGKFEKHIIKRHVISHLIEVLWQRILREAKVKL